MNKIIEMLLSNDDEMRQLGLILLLQQNIDIGQKKDILNNSSNQFHCNRNSAGADGVFDFFWTDEMRIIWGTETRL